MWSLVTEYVIVHDFEKGAIYIQNSTRLDPVMYEVVYTDWEEN